MAQQTAVEWLGSYIMSYLSTHEETLSIIKRAKAMEKEQIKKAYISGDLMEGRANLSDAEQYYNQTYNK